MKQNLAFFLIAFAVALVLAPVVIYFLKRLRTGQEILKYVEWHKAKTGTPTMGGWIFILPVAILAGLVLTPRTPLANIAILASMSYAFLGFLDDFLKVRRMDNLGLRAYQKIIGQGGIAILVAVFFYLANPDGRLFIPFFNVTWDIGFWILPLTVLVLVATTNSVNLTDGVDGLAATVSLVYLVALGFIIALVSRTVHVEEGTTFITLIAIVCGALVCYLLFNSNKAQVFMGDTGSLFLGGIIATLSMFSMMTLFVPILGIMFVISALSDIIQVAYFKATKGKRVFKMAPFHHHLEKSGWTEARIVWMYSAVTILVGITCVLFLL